MRSEARAIKGLTGKHTLADLERMSALWFSILVNHGCAEWNEAGNAVRLTTKDHDKVAEAFAELDERDPNAYALVTGYLEARPKVTP